MGFCLVFLHYLFWGVLIVFFGSAISLTLDFIGVTLKLFNSIAGLAGSFSSIINSHVHMIKFKELELNKVDEFKNNFVIERTIQ